MTKIKVMALSDMHGMLPDLRDHPVDLVLIAGDIAPEYTDYNADIAISWYTREFYRWCKSYVLAQKVFFILGSHDHALENFYPMLWETFHSNEMKVQFLHNEIKIFRKEGRELSVYGTEYNLNNGNHSFSKTDRELNKIYMKNNEFVDIVLSHEAPYGFSDTNNQTEAAGYQGVHHGSQALRRYIQRMEPEVVIHRKYHSATHFKEKLQDTDIYNVCLMDENHELTFKPLIFEI